MSDHHDQVASRGSTRWGCPILRIGRQLPAYSPLTLGAIIDSTLAAWLGRGREALDALGDELRARYAPSDLLLTDSGTSALRLALQAAHRQTGAPVALPAYTCFDVATAADGAGVPFVLYDLVPETLSPESDSLRRAFEAGARSAVVAHLYGVPVDIKAVQKVAGEFGAIIIEDAAQGSGCEWKGRPAGAHGTLGVLSFGRGKGMTGGRGGALLVNDPQLVAAVQEQWTAAVVPSPALGSVKDVALLKAQWLFGRPWLYWIPSQLLPSSELGETIYRRPHPIGGISALAAGVVSRTLRLVPDEIAHRRMAARWLRSRVTGVTHISPAEEWEAGWLRYPVILPGRAVEGVGPRHRAAGVMPGYPRALADLEGFGVRRLNPEEALEGARMLADRLVTFPTHRFRQSSESATSICIQGRRYMISRMWLEGMRLGASIAPRAPKLGIRRLLLPVSYWRSVEFAYVWKRLVLRPGARILDLGSPKDLALFLARARGYEVVATDILPSAIALSDRYARAYGRNGDGPGLVSSQIQDGRSLTYEDASFDAAYSVSVLEHIPDDGDSLAIRELMRVVRPGGVIVVTTPFDLVHRDTYVKMRVYERDFDGTRPVFFERHYDQETLERRLITPAGGRLADLEFWGEGRWRGEALLSRLGPLRTPLSPIEAPLASLLLRRMELDSPGGHPMAAFFTLERIKTG